jgi:RHS repeat-associated protein
MQLSSDANIPDGLLAANVLLSEKPHQGVPSWNLAPHQGIDERNSTAAIGLRVGQHLNRAWSRYTQKEHDAESGNDYFEARYYSETFGRFLQADWSAKEEPVPYAKMDDPQSLNLYSYVENNPLDKADPTGHDPTKKEVIKELNRLADKYGVPRPVIQAIAKTESNYDVNAKNDNKDKKGNITSTDYGVMQVNSKHINEKVTGADGKQFTITNSIKTDWKDNANAGVALAAEQYKSAEKEQNPTSAQDQAQQTYSGYNAGSGGRDRYLLPGPQAAPNYGFQDKRDAGFLQNYQDEIKKGDDQ